MNELHDSIAIFKEQRTYILKMSDELISKCEDMKTMSTMLDVFQWLVIAITFAASFINPLSLLTALLFTVVKLFKLGSHRKKADARLKQAIATKQEYVDATNLLLKRVVTFEQQIKDLDLPK